MKKIIAILFFAFFFTKNMKAQEWYKGGTLHSANLLEWKQATEKNKLATTADWIVTLFNKKGISLVSKKKTKERAIKIRKCTNSKVIKFKSKTNLKVLKANEIAYKCMIELGYFK